MLIYVVYLTSFAIILQIPHAWHVSVDTTQYCRWRLVAPSVLPALAVSMRSRMTDPSYTSTGNYCSNFQDHVSPDFYFTDIRFCIDLIPTCLIM